MKLEEKHKQFAVKSFAKLMTRTEVVNAFMEEFDDDLPKPSIQVPQYPTIGVGDDNTETGIDHILDREEYYAECFNEYHRNYNDLYGNEAKTKFDQDLPKIREQIEKDYKEKVQQQLELIHNDNLLRYQEELQEHRQNLKSTISSQLRRYNISHSQFPLKYRELFNQTHREYLAKLT